MLRRKEQSYTKSNKKWSNFPQLAEKPSYIPSVHNTSVKPHYALCIGWNRRHKRSTIPPDSELAKEFCAYLPREWKEWTFMK